MSLVGRQRRRQKKSTTGKVYKAGGLALEEEKRRGTFASDNVEAYFATTS